MYFTVIISIFIAFLLLLLLYDRFKTPGPLEEIRKILEASRLGLSKLENLPENYAGLKEEVSRMNERVLSVERRQSDDFREVKEKLEKASSDLSGMQSFARAREALEDSTAKSVKRLELIIAGSQSKGSAGENIVEELFSKLPPEWQVRGFTVENKTVEFGLRLPSGLVLPVDSKWTATELYEKYSAAENPEEKKALKKEIERAVLAKAEEVTKYIHPDLTAGFGLAVLPDAVYELCGAVFSKAFGMNVIIVSYSMFLPYLLLVFQTALKSSRTVDTEKLFSNLSAVESGIKEIQEIMEHKYSRSLVMLQNAKDELGFAVSKIQSGLARIQGSGPAALPGLTTPRSPFIKGEFQPAGLPEVTSVESDGK